MAATPVDCKDPDPSKATNELSLFAWLISHQPAVLFSQNKPVTSNQPTVLFSQNKSAQAISQTNRLLCSAGKPPW
jgi:hypothetical protein